MSEDYVCDACFGDIGLQQFVSENAVETACSFCGREDGEPIAAPIEDVAHYIKRCLQSEYDDAANCLPYESAEGGYIGVTWDTYELLNDKLELELPNDDGALLDAIVWRLDDMVWCEADPFALNYAEHAHFSWQRFADTVKHKRRFFFADYGAETDEETWTPGETLRRILEYAREVGLFHQLQDGLRLYRARFQEDGEHWATASQLGPPPQDCASQTNRMSPPGLVMMYVSDQTETALRETASGPATFAVGDFETRRTATILDLCHLPPSPSLFQEIQDTLEYNPRPVLSFLRHVVKNISQPIARDDRVHVSYVPTQVVTEFVRAYQGLDQPIDGIRYPSAAHPGGTSYVLFATQDNLLPAPEPEEPYLSNNDDRWLELMGRSEYQVSPSEFAAWHPCSPPPFGSEEDE